MTDVLPLPETAPSEQSPLAHWMDRALKELEDFRKTPDPDTVHHLRVVLRRCRTLASVMREVDPDPAWKRTRGAPRKLFRSLGNLRDVQVQQDWLKKLRPDGLRNLPDSSDSLGPALAANLQKREPGLFEKALRKAAKFDDKEWKQLARTAARRARVVPPGSPAAECLALERLEDAVELHKRALRTDRARPWHKLRIGLKRFRYTVQGLLPGTYANWSGDLKRLQDLLGGIHDLDVLHELIRRQAPGANEPDRLAWEEIIAGERAARIQSYRQLTLGANGLWTRWRFGLPANGKLEAAALGRLHATAVACDPHRRRTAHTARLAKGLFDALRGADGAPLFTDARAERMLAGVSLLHGIGPAGRRGAQRKAAVKFLAKLPIPAGWTAEDWELVRLAIRYHRGGEPKPGAGKFARLGVEQQGRVSAVAGLFRIARALRKAGVARAAGIRAELSPADITIRVPDLPDTPEAAATLAKAKPLLERAIGKPLVFAHAQPGEKIVVMRETPVAAASEPLAAASD